MRRPYWSSSGRRRLILRVEARLFRDEDEFHSPHFVDVEATQGLGRLVRAGDVSADRAAEAIADLAELDLHPHAHIDLLTRAWKLRENVTARRDVRSAGRDARCVDRHLRHGARQGAGTERSDRSARLILVDWQDSQREVRIEPATML